jgi:ATP-dependent DNA helicase PIF1
MTIHAWSGIGIRESLSVHELDLIAGKEHVARRIQKAQVLIIDEVSMLSANVLSMADRVCREVRRRPEAFGGMQVVLVGDFFQLPPVSRGGGAPFAFESTTWTDLHPVVCYLTEQHRQDDSRFVSVLAGIREGSDDPGIVSAILSRETTYDEELEDIPRLFTHNADVDRLNQERLAGLSGKAVSYGMTGTGAPVLIESLKRGCLSPESLVLKEGSVVMGTKNLPQLGLANGTLGLVLGFERGTNYPIIETRDGRKLTVPPAEWAVEEGGRVRAKIGQVPLRLAWAITIHKSQGMSMDAAAMDLSRAFEYGQGYVALSRVRRLEGLYLLGWSEQALMVHPDVRNRDRSFRALSDEAEVAFAALDESGELLELTTNFVRACGGTMDAVDSSTSKQKAVKVTTYDKTLALLKEGMTLREAALDRNLTYGTICSHAEKLAQSHKLPAGVLDRSLPDFLKDELDAIHTAFDKLGSEHLTPVYEQFKGKFSYDDLRAARVAYALDHAEATKAASEASSKH